MEETGSMHLAPLKRMPTGVPGLDEIVGGGLFRGGVYMIVGRPGGGKTTLASQLCFTRASAGESVLYVTLLTESHGRLLANLQNFSFFDASRVGAEIHFANGYSAMEQDGLDGLLKLLRQSMRERRAALLVIDGMVTVEALAASPTAYKKFIQELQTWAGLVGCTVLVLTSAEAEPVGPEHTMVDGIFELSTRMHGRRADRQLIVSKFRGSSYLEGSHAYRITGQGITVYPRFEAIFADRQDGFAGEARVPSGVPGLDELLDGGFAPRSLTLTLGPSGSGKTLLGLQFLARGAADGERCLLFGFFETPAVLREKARRFGLHIEQHLDDGRVSVVWQSMTEHLLDELGHKLLRAIDEQKATRVFVDGLVAFEQSSFDPSRLGTYFAALAEELRRRGVTAIVSAESRQLYVQDVAIPIPGISASFENILFLRQVEAGGELVRLVTVLKTRDSQHASGIHSLDIAARGVRVGAPFVANVNPLTRGPAKKVAPAKKAAPKTRKSPRRTPSSRQGKRSR